MLLNFLQNGFRREIQSGKYSAKPECGGNCKTAAIADCLKDFSYDFSALLRINESVHILQIELGPGHTLFAFHKGF